MAVLVVQIIYIYQIAAISSYFYIWACSHFRNEKWLIKFFFSVEALLNDNLGKIGDLTNKYENKDIILLQKRVYVLFSITKKFESYSSICHTILIDNIQILNFSRCFML
jgi:hypothetical protein